MRLRSVVGSTGNCALKQFAATGVTTVVYGVWFGDETTRLQRALGCCMPPFETNHIEARAVYKLENAVVQARGAILLHTVQAHSFFFFSVMN